MTESPTKFLPEHIIEALKTEVAKQTPATKICLYNFEASNSAADSVSSYVFSYSPIQVHTILDRNVPAWANSNVDVIIMSYSGNSPEVEEVYEGAKAKGCRIHCITSGGKLKEICESYGDNLVLVPQGLSNANATGYEIGVLVNLYEAMGVEGLRKAVEEALPRIIEYRDAIWESDEVRKLAMRIRGKIPAIYCTGELRAVHKRWKMLINDEVGRLAFSGEFPEFDHNELVGWADEKTDAYDFIIIAFRINTESDLLNRIFDIATALLKENGLDVRVIDIEGNIPERGIRGIIYADAVAKYLKEAE